MLLSNPFVVDPRVHKEAKAKIAIVRKHGMHGLLSHVYLWPAYGLMGLLAAVDVLLVLLFFASVLYALLVAFESGRLSRRFGDPRLFLYALLLLPTVHVSYGYGALYALFRRRIW